MRCFLDGGEGAIERRVNDNCRLCCCLLKILFGEFKEFHAKSFSWPLREGTFNLLGEGGGGRGEGGLGPLRGESSVQVSIKWVI